MTPKFDNLASLLMEMPRGVPITDEEKLEIAEYIEQFPRADHQKIADAFGVHSHTVEKIAMKLDVQRSQGRRPKLTDDQEKQILDYWMANHHDMTLGELARWIKQQFNVVVTPVGLAKLLKRVAAKQVPPVQLPPGDKGKGNRLKKQRSQHRNEPGTGKLPTQGSQYFSGSTDIVPSNPKHGGPAHPPKSPGE